MKSDLKDFSYLKDCYFWMKIGVTATSEINIITGLINALS
jgi:hypothetical protein